MILLRVINLFYLKLNVLFLERTPKKRCLKDTYIIDKKLINVNESGLKERN